MNQVKKAQIIRDWYKKECENLNFGDRLKLAKAWINICLKDEEYEIAAAIKSEKTDIIKRHIREKRKNRELSQKVIIYIYLIKRRIYSWIKNMR